MDLGLLFLIFFSNENDGFFIIFRISQGIWIYENDVFYVLDFAEDLDLIFFSNENSYFRDRKKKEPFCAKENFQSRAEGEGRNGFCGGEMAFLPRREGNLLGYKWVRMGQKIFFTA